MSSVIYASFGIDMQYPAMPPCFRHRPSGITFKPTIRDNAEICLLMSTPSTEHIPGTQEPTRQPTLRGSSASSPPRRPPHSLQLGSSFGCEGLAG